MCGLSGAATVACRRSVEVSDARDRRLVPASDWQKRRRLIFDMSHYVRHLNARLLRNCPNAAPALSIVLAGPVSLMKYGPFGVSTTVARIRYPGLL